MAELMADIMRGQSRNGRINVEVELNNLTLGCEEILPKLISYGKVVITAVENDENIRRVKNASKPPNEHKDALATSEEIQGARETLKNLREAAHNLEVQLEQFNEFRRLINRRLGERRLAKAEKRARIRHCVHCAGAIGSCVCRAGCNVPETSLCYTKHCMHCPGITNTLCECDAEPRCIRTNRVRCVPDNDELIPPPPEQPTQQVQRQRAAPRPIAKSKKVMSKNKSIPMPREEEEE